MEGAITGVYASVLTDLARRRVHVDEEIHPYTLNDGGVLGNVECPTCNNTGRIITKNGLELRIEECGCMNLRRNRKRLKESGLLDLMEEYSMENFKVVDQWTSKIKAKMLEYVNAPRGWFYIYGISGSGKTHTCTALCSELMNRGKSIRYVIWSELVKDLNAIVNDLEFGRRLDGLKNVDVLYIDDFLKDSPTDSTAKRAFDVINARYNMPSKKTIISSERNLNYVAGIDPAIAGRINQRSRGFYIKTPDKDWRVMQ